MPSKERPFLTFLQQTVKYILLSVIMLEIPGSQEAQNARKAPKTYSYRTDSQVWPFSINETLKNMWMKYSQQMTNKS